VKVVVGGGSGYVGRALVASLRADGHQVTIVSRQPSGLDTVSWDTAGSAIAGADGVVNIAGVSIGRFR
jgi:uncharacterized protein YbjT (DUF2867 family)